MPFANRDSIPPDMVRAVRQTAGPAAIAAACLLIFGYYVSGAFGSSLFLVAHSIMLWTLRIGGVAMVISAAWCWWGRPSALLFDGVAAIVIGMLLLVSAALMIVAGAMGLAQALYLVFGYLFVSSGARSWRTYRDLMTYPGSVLRPDSDYDPNFERSYAEARKLPVGASLASRLREKRTDHKPEAAAELPAGVSPEDEEAQLARSIPLAEPAPARRSDRRELSAPTPMPPEDVPDAGPLPEPGPEAPPAEPPEDEPPGGFLASFGQDGGPRAP
ncbi:MAG TPA: hypothetical protein PKK06_11570 [Phycisphaerae bacterium]|nr:hypothetical protein [Phycisphaerae bacterium]HNU45900.1 hypothetical protein [Phycisphaerae bacterium]